jgi:hypothetical protein
VSFRASRVVSVRSPWVVLAIAISACSAKPRAPTPCAQEPRAFYLQRRTEVTDAFAIARSLKSSAMIPFPAQAARDACAAAAEVVRPFCFEGLARAYGAAISDALKSAKQAPVADFEKQLQAADGTWTRVHCRGFGNGLAGLELDRAVEVLASLPQRCAQHGVDGMAAGSAWRAVADIDRCQDEDTPACNAMVEEFFSHFEIDARCARHMGPAADWCAYGTGRMLGNFFAGRFEEAMKICRGRSRAACLSGVGFVSVYLYPDHIEGALNAARHLAPSDQGGFFEGVANGLQWRRESDAARFDGWLARLSPDDLKLAREILAAATDCGLVDFHSGTNCRWRSAQRACEP